ncbi:hypothetical protein [Streptomyces sp. NPDC050546]|uniref:hypothetical protein n=1 Tax=Streptomyces sp. NPDC050546 TaxID=3365628 RepID=UPI003797BB71
MLEGSKRVATSDPSGGDLLALVDIVDEYGPELVLATVRKLHPEREADVVVSTGHKAKGREWPTVKVVTDFEPKAGGRKEPAENSGKPAIGLGSGRPDQGPAGPARPIRARAGRGKVCPPSPASRSPAPASP